MKKGQRLASCWRVVSTLLWKELSAEEEELEARGAAPHTSRDFFMFLAAAQKVTEQVIDVEREHYAPVLIESGIFLSDWNNFSPRATVLSSKEQLKTKQFFADGSPLLLQLWSQCPDWGFIQPYGGSITGWSCCEPPFKVQRGVSFA